MIPVPATSVALDTRHPRIGYNNLGATGSLTVTNEQAGYEGVNLFDGKPFTYYQAIAGVQTVTCLLPYAQRADYFAIAQHNLGTYGATIALEYSLDNGSTWHQAAAASPSGTETLWLPFTSITAAYWRVKTTAPAPVIIAVAFFGSHLKPTFGDINSWTPPILARDTVLYTSETDGGNFLPRSILSRGQSFTIKWDHQLPQWMYANWLPFMKYAEGGNFFLAWNVSDFAFDVAFCRTDGAIPHPTYSRPGRVSMSLKLQGLLV